MTKELTIKALVLREIPMGESDKLITVLAKDMGKLLISCKGVRNTKSHRLSSTQLFCYDEFTLTEKDEKYYLKEAALIENFYSIREDIEKLALAQYVLQVTEEVSIEGEYDNSVLSLVLNTLYMISSSNKGLKHIKACFELRIASILGFMPDLSECSVCARKTPPPFFLDIEGGNIICKDCMSEISDFDAWKYADLSAALFLAVRYVISAPPKRVFSFNLGSDEDVKFFDLCERYLLTHLEKDTFDTLKFYRSLGL